MFDFSEGYWIHPDGRMVDVYYNEGMAHLSYDVDPKGGSIRMKVDKGVLYLQKVNEDYSSADDWIPSGKQFGKIEEIIWKRKIEKIVCEPEQIGLQSLFEGSIY